MATKEISREESLMVRARQRLELAELDYRRQLRAAARAAVPQREIASWVGVSQPAISSALKAAEGIDDPVDGFSGATPYEICQRYAAGLIGLAQLVEELARYPYAEPGKTDGYDSLIVDPPGTWDEVAAAMRRGLISRDEFTAIYDGRFGDPAAPPTPAGSVG